MTTADSIIFGIIVFTIAAFWCISNSSGLAGYDNEDPSP